ncbi:MAG: hypothetical protein WA885_12025 [Phormidesmis sp.]
MTLNEIQDSALKLSVEERLQLIDSLIRSVQSEPASKVRAKGLAASLIGIAKTDTPTPTDSEVKAILGERRMKKYL